MKPNIARFVFSLVLILAGGVLLATNLGYIQASTPLLWGAFFGGLSVLFFLTYFLNGLRSWWWLFPAMILGSVGITIGLGSIGQAGAGVGTLILASIALPFFAAFAADTRNNWWALIPGTLMGVISVIPLIENRVVGEVIGSMVLFSLAVPFLVIFLTNTERRWALIPALVLGCVGLIPLMTVFANERILPVMIMGLFAAAFLAVFVAVRSAWWALIPAGIFASIGAGVFASVPNGAEAVGSMVAGIMFLGWAATFFILWLLRGSRPTAWAVYPALGCAAVAVITITFAPGMRFVWPIALILLGGWVLYKAVRKSSTTL
jgi:hypothetical protein